MSWNRYWYQLLSSVMRPCSLSHRWGPEKLAM